IELARELDTLRLELAAADCMTDVRRLHLQYPAGVADVARGPSADRAAVGGNRVRCPQGLQSEQVAAHQLDEVVKVGSTQLLGPDERTIAEVEPRIAAEADHDAAIFAQTVRPGDGDSAGKSGEVFQVAALRRTTPAASVEGILSFVDSAGEGGTITTDSEGFVQRITIGVGDGVGCCATGRHPGPQAGI